MPTPPTRLAAALVPLLLALSAHAQSLDARINTLLTNPQLKGASVSLDITEMTPKGPVPLFSHDATLPLGPASNCKLLTTAAAFERYGPNATFKTNLFRVGDDLLLVGGGDPALGDSRLAQAKGETPISVFEQFADRLQHAGITSYHDLIVDDRIFDQNWINPHWPPADALSHDDAPIGGLNFNANCLAFTPKLTPKGPTLDLMPETTYVTIVNKATRGSTTKISLVRPPTSNKFVFAGTLATSASTPSSVPIYDPGLWTGTILRDVLARAGIHGERIRRAAPQETFTGGALLATHETPILSVITRANTNSLNMMAEGLCKRLGYDASSGKEPGSWATGTAAVEAFAVSLGAKPDWISLDDGSGLSNKNRVAARTFTLVLAHVAARSDGDKFIDTLAEPGEEGTLEKRFNAKSKSGRMSVAGHIHAKTGHINGVSTLSGYILVDGPATRRFALSNSGSPSETLYQDGPAPRRFAFSILCNKYQGNVNPWQDEVCQAIYEWAGGK